MKKVLAWVLLLTLVLGAFAGCKQKPEPEVTEPPYQGAGAADAIEYLKGFYTDGGKKTPVDYTRFGIVRVGGVAFDVVWSVDVSEDLVKVVPNEDGTVTIDINEACEEDTEYTLIATVTDAQGNTSTHSWTYVLPKGVDMVEVVKSAYALKPGESLPYESRLIGKIVSIDSIWSEDYQNVTVTIAVEGAEDMPIKCYRMKANDSTLEAARNLKVGNIITVCGTIKNYEGTIEFDAGCILEKVEKGDAIDAPTDPGEILKAAYALPQDAALPYQATLTGTVTEIDTPYDPAYGNISVVITVEGYENYPILCYRLKGTGVDQIAINDLITVTGIIKNYKGTIEYDAGCIMTNRVSGGGVAQGPSSDPNKIIPDALKLAPGEKLPYRATLTGQIYSVDNAYDPNYGNVTVTIKVNGVKIQCYRMVGDGIDQIRESDTITVSGVIENYNGKLEFGAKCTLDSWTMGPRSVNYGPLVEDTAYRLFIDQTNLGKKVYFDGTYSGTRLNGTDKGSKGADVFVERVSGKGVRFYFMEGNTKKYIEIEEYLNDKGQARGSASVTATPSCYWVYNSEFGMYIVNLPTAGKYFLGTYNTYDTFSASWIGYIDGTISGSAQFIAKFVAASDVPADGPSGNTKVEGTAVEEPVVGTGYKFGFHQNKVDGKPFLGFAGKMAGYYYAVSDVMAEMVDVYLEAADGGYYLYCEVNGTKNYLDVVPRDNDPTKVNVVLQTSGTHTVYQLNTEHKYVYTEAVGSEWYLGTFGTNQSISASLTSYISDTSTIGVSQFCAWFSEVEEVEVEEPDVTEPEATEPGGNVPAVDAEIVDDPVVETAYKLGMDKKDGKILYFNGNIADKSYRLGTTTNAAEAADVYLEAADGGYRLYFMKDGVKTYIRVSEYTKDDGKLGGTMELTTTVPAEVYSYDETVKTLIYTNGNNSYYIGTYSTFTTFSVSSTYFISGDKASTIDVSQFPARFYTVGEGSEPETTEPEATEPSTPGASAGVVAAPEAGTAYKLGMDKKDGKILYFNGNIADKSYRLGTTTNTAEAADVYLEAADGGYRLYFMDGNAKTYIRVSEYTKDDGKLGGTMELTTTVPAEVYSYDETVKTLIYTNGNNSYYIGTYSTFTTFSVSSTYFISGDKASTIDVSQFPARFYTVGEGSEPETTEPEETEPVTGEGFNKITSADQLTTGKYVMIVSTGYAPGVYDNGWLTPVQPVVSGNQVTDTKGAVWTLTVKGDSVVITDANGVAIAPKGGNNNGVSEKSYDWTWTFNNGTFRFAGVDADTVVLASNATTTGQYPGNHRFRGYKTKTVSDQSENYPCDFTLYKLSGEYVEPEVTEPEVTEPSQPSGGQVGMVTDPEVGVAYKLYSEQGNVNKKLYFAGTTANKDYYLATTEDGATSTDVYLEAANGGYYLYFLDNGAKTYIDMIVSGTYYNLKLSNAPGVVYTFDQQYNTLVANVDGTDCYMGTYKQYETLSCSQYSFISGSFPCHFEANVEGGEPEATEPEVTEPEVTEPSQPSGGQVGMVTDPEVGVAYKLYSEQGNVNKKLYFAGTTANKDYYLATTEDGATSTDVYLEAANGGYYLYFLDNGAKTYIDMIMSGTYYNLKLSNAPGVVYTFDQKYNTLVANVDGTDCYMGTYKQYETLSCSQYSFISGSFPCHFEAGVEGGEPGVTEPEVTEPEATEPSVGTESVVVDFSTYAKGTQYAEETHDLGNGISMHIVGCHLNTQLRVYQDAKYDGIAIFTCPKAISSLKINAGYRDASLSVYGSNDGVTWELIETVAVDGVGDDGKTSIYADYTVEVPAGTSYKYLKLDAVGAQIRIPNMTIAFKK